MTEMRFSDNEYTGKRKQTRREKFLAEMEQVLPWEALLAVIEPKYGNAGDGRRAYALETMLRIHLMHNWFGYSDPAMEEALYEVAPLRWLAGLSLAHGSVPDATRKLNFRRLLETNDLAPALVAAVNAEPRRQGTAATSGYCCGCDDHPRREFGEEQGEGT